MIRYAMAFLISLLMTNTGSANNNWRAWFSGNATDSTAEWQPALLLAGGGGDVDSAMQWLLRSAGGGDVVVLRASGSDGYQDYLFSELGIPVNSVRTILFNNRQAAFDPQIRQWIEQAEAIFIAGGDQSRYVRFWQDTPVQAALQRHLAQMKPMGGTSAGLAVLGDFAYSAEHRGDLTSKLALAQPLHRYITLASGFLPSPLLPHVLTDSHFTERARLGRLMVMLQHAHWLARSENEDSGDIPILGIGVDEKTALAISAAGDVTLHTSANGTATWVILNAPSPAPPENPRSGQATFDGLTASVVLLGPQTRANILRRSVDAPLDVRNVRIHAGRLHDATHE